jgi:excisionase family DNA binding protein
MGVTVTVDLNGVPVPIVLDDVALAAISDALPREAAEPASPFLTIPEAAKYLCCPTRQRVDDLLSSGRLTRVKDGSRTLIARAELESYLNTNGRRKA